ncbi:MAG: sirohydrochlorin chelatase [Acidimicrobiales bacterium]
MNNQSSLLLIGHGSRSKAGVVQFWQFADVLQLAAPQLQIASGLIEFAAPTLDEAIDDLAAGGAQGVVGVPLVLLGAGHMKDDGPAAIARARERHPDVAFRYARDLGVHPLVIDAIEQRARVAVARLARRPPPLGPSARTAIVLVGRGSSDPDANADLYKAARLLADHRGIAGDECLDEVQPAFVSLARPTVAEALDRACSLGATHIAVVPYFLFTGVLVERIAAQASHWAGGHHEVAVTIASEIGPDAGIAQLVLERFAEALAGDTRMNCDGCLYRIAIPGYEHRVEHKELGQPRAGYAHPL